MIGLKANIKERLGQNSFGNHFRTTVLFWNACFLLSTLSAHAEVGSFRIVSPVVESRDAVSVTEYMLNTSRRIDRAWSAPRRADDFDDDLPSSSGGLGDLMKGLDDGVKPPPLKRSIVRFTIGKDGTVGLSELTQSSGDSQIDGAAFRAIEYAAPFSRLPDGFNSLTVDYTFRPTESEVKGGSVVRH